MEYIVFLKKIYIQNIVNKTRKVYNHKDATSIDKAIFYFSLVLI